MRLGGVIPANILPLKDDLTIDVEAYKAHIRTLANTPGVTAIVCNGHAAEVASLSRAERRQAVALAAEAIGGKIPLIAGIHAENSLIAAELARDARDEGASALLAFPLPMLAVGCDQEAGYAHVAALAAAVPLPIVVFNFAAFTGMNYTLETLHRICAIETVAGVKEWSLDMRIHEQVRDMLQDVAPRVALLTSFSTNLLPALVSGADGILSGHASVIAGLQAKLFAEVQAGNLEAARTTYGQIQPLTKVIYRAPMANMYARMKEHLAMLGEKLTPAVRPPLTRIDETERAALRAALVQSGLIRG